MSTLPPDFALISAEELLLCAAHDPAWLEQRDRWGSTPLMAAICARNLELIERLLELGADPNAPADDGYPCLHLAIDLGREETQEQACEIVKRLLAAGADIHMRGLNDWTPLHLAAVRGYTDIAQVLIVQGADVNARTDIDDSATPLMDAALNGQLDSIKLLLAAGADATLTNDLGQTARLIAIQYGHPAAAELLA